MIVEERYLLERRLFFYLTGWLAFDIGCIGLVDLPDLIASYRSPISHRGVGSGETTDGAKHQRRLLVDAAGVGGVIIVVLLSLNPFELRGEFQELGPRHFESCSWFATGGPILQLDNLSDLGLHRYHQSHCCLSW